MSEPDHHEHARRAVFDALRAAPGEVRTLDDLSARVPGFDGATLEGALLGLMGDEAIELVDRAFVAVGEYAPGRAAPREDASTAPSADDDERAAIQAERDAPVENTRFDPAMIEGAPREAGHGPNGVQACPSRFDWIGRENMWNPLPPVAWICEGLQLCPGRPACVAGYGASGKTLAAQSLALSAASGRSIWNRFRVARPLIVRHLDHEQGRAATLRRYHRLAIGLGMSLEERGALDLDVAIFPRVYLDSEGAEDAYVAAFQAVDLVIIDALKGATPGTEENDSKIRECIDVLSRVSERTGCAFVMLHHAGKPKDEHADGRTVLRGSSAIFDACGSVFVLVGAKGPRLMSHQKAAAESAGGAVEDFYLRIEDVATADGGPLAGVKVDYLTREQVKPPVSREDEHRKRKREVYRAILANPGCGARTLRELVGGNARATDAAVDSLIDDGAVENKGTDKRPKYFPVPGTSCEP